LWENLESGWDYSDWIKNRVEKYGFVEGRDYVTFFEIPKTGGRRVEYYGALSMGKELAMVARTTTAAGWSPV
jgi:anti-repressor protein